MLLIILPAKNQNFVGPSLKEYTLPEFLPEIETLVKQLRGIDRKGLAALMEMIAFQASYGGFCAMVSPLIAVEFGVCLL